MTDDPKQCQMCKAWEDLATMGAFDGICAGWCRKHDKAMDSDELACADYEEFKEE
jgi:hypothetical protein